MTPADRAGPLHLIALVVVVFLSGSAFAAEPDRALIDARKYTSISPENVPDISVVAPDNSEVSGLITQRFARLLSAKGYRVRDDAGPRAGHSLSFEFHVERPGAEKPSVQLKGGLGSSGSRDFGLNFSVPLSRDKTPRSRYVLEARLASDENGQKIKWVGTAVVILLRGRDRADVLGRLAAGLMTVLGKNAQARRFKLRDAE